MKNRISTVQWVQWIAATLVAAAVTITFAYASFQTKSDADNSTSFIVERLDRIESKLDRLIERSAK